MLLSVVVVNWNSIEDLRQCLESLRTQTVQRLEVIVVDNGSEDGSADMVAAEFPEVFLVRETENLGFAEACNRGIVASHGEWVAMLNNDAVAEPDWAKALVDAATAAPADCGMLQSLLLYQLRPETVNSAGIELTRSGGGRDRKEGEPRGSSTEPEEIFCPTAGAAAYRRTMLDSIRIAGGYFDREHFMYFEDMDLGWRARLAGFSAKFVPGSVVLHRWHGSTERHGRAWLKAIANTNRVRTILKNASFALILSSAPATLEGAFNVARHGGVAGLWALMRAIPQSLSVRAEVTRLSRVSRRDVEAVWRSSTG
jgi:GT2 family glycosyltransferase